MSLTDKTTLKDFVKHIVLKVSGSQYEAQCKRLLRDFDSLNQHRIATLLTNLQSKANWHPIKTEMGAELKVLTVESNNDNVVVISDSESDSENRKAHRNKSSKEYDSAITLNNQNDSNDDDDDERLITPPKSKRMRVIESDDTISDRISRGHRKLKRVRTIESSNSSTASSKRVSTDSFYTATGSQQHKSLSENSDDDDEQPQVRRKRVKRTEAEILRTATVKTFIGHEMLTLSAKRKRRQRHSSYAPTSEESESEDSSCRVTPRLRTRRKKTPEKSQTPPPFVIVEEEQFYSDESDRPLFKRPLTVADITCEVTVRKEDFAHIKKHRVRVHQEGDEWKIGELIPVPVSNDTTSSDNDSDDGPIGGPIPITRSIASRSERTDASVDFDFDYVYVQERTANEKEQEEDEDEEELASESGDTLALESESVQQPQVSVEESQASEETDEDEEELASESGDTLALESESVQQPQVSLEESQTSEETETEKNETVDIDDFLMIIETPLEIIEIDDDDDAPRPDLYVEKEKYGKTQPGTPTTPLPVPRSPAKESPVPKVIADSEKRVENLAFTLCRTGVNLKCFAGSCIFATDDDEMFGFHVLAAHSIEKWSGFCNLCQKSCGDISPLSCELKHMKERHIRGQSTPTSVASEQSSARKRGRPRKNSKQPNAVRKELLSPSENPPESSETSGNVAEQLKTVSSLIGELTENETNVNKEASAVEKESTAPTTSDTTKLPLATISVPQDNANAAKIIPVMPSSENQAAVTKIRSVDFSNIEENRPGSAKLMLRVKNLPGDKLSTSNTSSETLTASNGEVTPNPPNVAQNTVQTTKTPTPPIFAGQRLPFVMSARTMPVTFPIVQSKPYYVLTPVTIGPNVVQSQPRPISIVPRPPPIAPKLVLSNITAEQQQVLVRTSPAMITIQYPASSLRPWLASTEKIPQTVPVMRRIDCLMNLYKCMEKNCSFHVAERKCFEVHLRTHFYRATTMIKFTCPYCLFEDDNDKVLVDHISNVHGKCKYVCQNCFFRGSSLYVIQKHVEKYHKNASVSFAALAHVRELNEDEELENVMSKRHLYITPISCAACKKKFFDLSEIEKHREHSMNIVYKCNVCSQETTEMNLRNHLKTCHKINHFQCVYCKWGEDSDNMISDHLISAHPERLPYFCERRNTKQVSNPSSIDSTTIRQFTVKRLPW